MKVFVLLLLVGASLAVIADHEENLENLSDDDLVTIAEREPEPEDEQETGANDEQSMEDDDFDDLSGDLNQMCNVTHFKKPSFAHVDNDEDDDNSDDEYKSGLEVHMKHRHRPGSRHQKKHHRHVKHWKHKKHGKRGKRGMCRRQFCRCKMTAGNDCKKLLRCFMLKAFCMRKRRCHMRPHRYGPRLKLSLKRKLIMPGTYNPNKPFPKKKCIDRFKQCLANTTRGDCKGILRCVKELQKCMRGGNMSESIPMPNNSLMGSEQVEDEFSVYDSFMQKQDNENRPGRGFCRSEYQNCVKNTQDECRKKFCFVRMAHCVRCSPRHHRRHGSFTPPMPSRPPFIRGQKTPWNLWNGFRNDAQKIFSYKISKPLKPWYKVLKNLKQWPGFQKLKHPRLFPADLFKRPAPTANCKQVLDNCLNETFDVDCRNKMKCFMGFLRCRKFSNRP